MTEHLYAKGDQVRSGRHGIGRVEVDTGLTVIARFGQAIYECSKSELSPISTPAQTLVRGTWDSPLEVVLRVQAEAIRSINDTWGVFARSRIELLPHQLWVCRKVLQDWPARWMVADDVGLGKTVEAGLILSALFSRQRIRRLLVICPASLVDQWQYRLRTMFDIRTAIYIPEADTSRRDFWNTSPQVIISLQTLRKDSKGRHTRLLQSEPWDLVIVDEAHHLNADEQAGPTQGYQVVNKLVEGRRVRSMVFFTGTPHRGKPYGFFALLSLLRPDLFSPRKSAAEQFPLLPRVMIRNNKQNVTDLHGNPLFQQPRVTSRTYEYSPAESHFYDMLTEFIVSGKAYASGLSGNDARVVILVLIAMQKLASSSVAAIRRALKGRLARISEAARRAQELEEVKRQLSLMQDAEEEDDGDTASVIEENMSEAATALRLMEDERERLEELVTAAEGIAEETKIRAIVKEVEEYGPDQSVLFFTEYKATQSLLMSALIKAFGEGCVAFINGDEEARDVVGSDGSGHTLRQTREDAAALFNGGRVRFLVSTEAGGEGIDLQENCHTLIHVDLPWNPMRLHQRVGRLNRYGQKQQVHVTTIRNPHTVESRIWDKLNEKIEHINRALSQVMSEPEDMLQLVLGMTSRSVINDVFFDGPEVPPESFDSWFDSKTALFGGQDAIDAVKNLVGQCARFDFREVSEKLPKVDLPDLKAFFVGMLLMNRRRPQETDEGLSFKTPDEWLVEPAILPGYQDMQFDRSLRGEGSTEHLLGLGHRLVDLAIEQARGLSACVAAVPADMLESPLYVFRVYDRVTSTDVERPPRIFGVQIAGKGPGRVLADWELLKVVNGMSAGRLVRVEYGDATAQGNGVVEQMPAAEAECHRHALDQDLGFAALEVELLGVLLPAPRPDGGKAPDRPASP